MLLLAPPRIEIVGLPWISRAFGTVGLRTMMGIGDAACCRPHTAEARIAALPWWLSKPEKKVWALSRTSTLMKGGTLAGRRTEGGAVTPGGAEAAFRKLTYTLLPVAEEETGILLSYPFKAAYWHGA